MGFRPFELAPGRNLLIAVLVPESDFLGDLVAQRNQFLATTTLALLAAMRSDERTGVGERVEVAMYDAVLATYTETPFELV